MSQNLFFILLLALLLVAGFLIGRRSLKNSGLEKAWRARRESKERAKERIMELFSEKDKITNDDVQKLLESSHATATNYLDELQKDGKIVQNGDIGRGVFYNQINN